MRERQENDEGNLPLSFLGNHTPTVTRKGKKRCSYPDVRGQRTTSLPLPVEMGAKDSVGDGVTDEVYPPPTFVGGIAAIAKEGRWLRLRVLLEWLEEAFRPARRDEPVSLQRSGGGQEPKPNLLRSGLPFGQRRRPLTVDSELVSGLRVLVEDVPEELIDTIDRLSRRRDPLRKVARCPREPF